MSSAIFLMTLHLIVLFNFIDTHPQEHEIVIFLWLLFKLISREFFFLLKQIFFSRDSTIEMSTNDCVDLTFNHFGTVIDSIYLVPYPAYNYKKGEGGI